MSDCKAVLSGEGYDADYITLNCETHGDVKRWEVLWSRKGLPLTEVDEAWASHREEISGPAWNEMDWTWDVGQKPAKVMTWTYTAWDVPAALAEMFEVEFAKLRSSRPPLSPVQLTSRDSSIVMAVLRRVLDEDVELLGALNSIIADLGMGRTLTFEWQEDRRG